jgi:hypothetical protein
MGFRKKKKVEEEVIEEVKEEEEKEVEDEILPLDEDETPDDSKETGDIEDILVEAPKVETDDIRVGNKVKIKSPRDYEGRLITVDEFSSFTVYAIEGNKVQLRGPFGRILFVRLSNIKKIK